MEQDRQFKEHTITSVSRYDEEHGGGWTIGFDCMGFYVPPDSPIVPEVGMDARFYGKGLGYPVRGLTLNGVVVFYRTEEEQAEHHRRDVEESQRKQREEFEANRDELDTRFYALPQVFRDRITRFRYNNPDFRWKYERYELFSCEQAVVIAEALKTPDAIESFASKSWDEQKRLVPGLDEGHSGNTFGMAVRLAWLYLANPEGVKRMHGALAPLVGSEEYGCVPREAA